MRKLFFVFSCYFFTSLMTLAQQPLPAINKEALKANTKELSSDYYQGRKPFTIGEKRALEFIKNKFKGAGLKPGNRNSFFQPVPLMETDISNVSPLIVKSDEASESFEYMKDFVLLAETSAPQINLNDDIIFAGYGVVAPEYNWNDYAGLDVKGKVVLVMVNDPGFGVDTTIFKGKNMTYYGRWTYKFEEAARQGAKACFVIHNTAAAAYGFNVVQNSNNGSDLFLDERANPQPHTLVNGWFSASAAKKILALAGKDTSLLVSANKKDFKAVSLGLKATLTAKVTSHYSTSQNVIGMIKGTKRPNEYIIYTSHWDHLGVGAKEETGDSIYNGAQDNATGIAGLIELAKTFKKMKKQPDRSVLFIAVTAEEQGLLGSKYYAENPVYPLKNTVAVINMDALNVYDRTKDISIGGFGQNELEDYAIEAAAKQGRSLKKGGYDTGGGYFRSDHFSFVKQGVPALAAGSGSDYGDTHEAEIGKKYADLGKRYHSTKDEFNPDWTFEGAAADLQLYFLVGYKLANEKTWPKWKEGSEFKAIREKQ
ncbi:MAG: peptidase M28 [Sphingobacteriales bacterium 41-5]|nr:MAG: peptidase M28 [Sphingobacteriales bacterium 41-5]